MPVTETQIANRAIGLLGASDYIATGALRTENSRNAIAILNVYDQDRRAELRRNVWRFAIRNAAIRPVGPLSKFVTFGNWAIGTTYAQNDIIVGSDGNVYISLVAANIGNDPTATFGFWQLYFGNLCALEYVTTWVSTISYDLNNHTVGSDGQVYISIVTPNLNHNPVGDAGVHWVVATDGTVATTDLYYSGELLYVGFNLYILAISQTTASSPTGGNNFLKMTTQATLANFDIIYPIGSGPQTQDTTRNIYRLPNGFLRQAPADPKAGSTLFLGAPSALPYSDWDFQDQFIRTRDAGPQFLRFVCDVADPNMFDPMFVAGFAARLAEDCCQAITQSSAKQADMIKAYEKTMVEARLVNGIETGAYQPPEDDWITCRV